MTNDFYLCLQWWFQSAWRLLTSFYFPGTNVTPAGMLLFGASAVIGFRFLKYILFTGNSGSGDSNEKD